MNPKLTELIKTDNTFPVSQETWERTVKPTMVCLHHTASGEGTIGDITWWKRDSSPVSTPLVIDRDGTAVQIYSTKRWAFSLGLKVAKARQIEQATIGVEIDSWGGLVQRGGKYYAWPKNYGVEVPADEVCVLAKPHRGFTCYHKYTPEQIETVRLLLIHWNEVYGIPLKYVGDDKMFGVCKEAIAGTVPGIYSHNSFRSDKSDIHPQPDMIEMLRNLDN